MTLSTGFFNKKHKIDALLFLCSFCIYFVYFHTIFLNINSILSSITLDSLKNYYTFVYHIKNDATALNFSGLNYPYGEHVVYTDCQPLLTFALRLLPFTHNHLIGILHALMFLSFIVSPVILLRIFRLLEIEELPAFFFSLGIALLAPQFLKINAGHFALAYGCIFPLAILLLLKFIRAKGRKELILLCVFNSLLFLLHPYLGFCVAVFSLITLLLYELMHFKRQAIVNTSFSIFIISMLPLILFKLFMWLTDTHVNRTTEPFGAALMVENLDSIMAPVFGPFQSFMEHIFPNRTTHYEGHSYLGFSTITLSLITLILLPFQFKKIQINKGLLAIFISSVFILFLSFGIHMKIFEAMHIKSAALNQFRAVCRFSWLFYYSLPLFIIPMLYHLFRKSLSVKKFKMFFSVGSILFFSINLAEAHYFFKLDESSYWNFRNFFNRDYLNSEEKNNLLEIAKNKPQAIIPLPIYHGGSEMYDRLGSSNSMIPSMIYSYHANTPILSVMLSRTSLTETENLIQTLNSYKKEKPITTYFNESDFFVINTKDAKLPDEERLLKKVILKGGNDTLQFGFISKKNLLERKMDSELLDLNKLKNQVSDSSSVIFIETEKRKPFLEAIIKDYETIYVLDSNKIVTGKYVVSMHYYYTKNTYQALACGLIVVQSNALGSVWQYTIPIRYLSGFYNGYGVFEYSIELSKGNKYEFILKGDLSESYYISDFLLRPEKISTRYVTHLNDTLYNNFSN